MGAIPFTLISLVPPHAVASASSIGLAVNWSVNFLVGVTFLPLSQQLADSVGGTGTIFFVFAGLSVISTSYLARIVKA